MLTKEFITANIRKIDDIGAIYLAIKNNVVTFQELKNTGGFVRAKQIAVEELLKEDEMWSSAKDKNTISSYQTYLNKYPSGKFAIEADGNIISLNRKQEEEAAFRNARSIRQLEAFVQRYPDSNYAPEAYSKIEVTRNQIEQNKYALIENIRKNPQNFPPETIKDKIRNGELTKQDLISHSLITKDALDLFLNPPSDLKRAFDDTRFGWSELNGMMSEDPTKTDVYFFGIPRSGKSCMLGGILYYAHRNGTLMLDIKNKRGRKYGDLLISTTNMGYSVEPTQEAGANFIEAELENEERGTIHSVNMVDMSGELFLKAYDEFDVSSQNSIGANGFLGNSNQKAIFLVIDYVAGTNRVQGRMADQAQVFNAILRTLEDSGTFAHTDALFLVLTKCDLMEGDNKDDLAEEFIEKEFRTLRRQVRRLKDQYGFESRILTFSLGRFMLEKTFIYNSRFSGQVFDALVNTCQISRRVRPSNPSQSSGGFFSRFFS